MDKFYICQNIYLGAVSTDVKTAISHFGIAIMLAQKLENKPDIDFELVQKIYSINVSFNNVAVEPYYNQRIIRLFFNVDYDRFIMPWCSWTPHNFGIQKEKLTIETLIECPYCAAELWKVEGTRDDESFKHEFLESNKDKVEIWHKCLDSYWGITHPLAYAVRHRDYTGFCYLPTLQVKYINCISCKKPIFIKKSEQKSYLRDADSKLREEALKEIEGWKPMIVKHLTYLSTEARRKELERALNCLTVSGFKDLRGSFQSWAMPILTDAIAKISQLISPSTYENAVSLLRTERKEDLAKEPTEEQEP